MAHCRYGRCVKAWEPIPAFRCCRSPRRTRWGFGMRLLACVSVCVCVCCVFCMKLITPRTVPLQLAGSTIFPSETSWKDHVSERTVSALVGQSTKELRQLGPATFSWFYSTSSLNCDKVKINGRLDLRHLQSLQPLMLHVKGSQFKTFRSAL